MTAVWHDHLGPDPAAHLEGITALLAGAPGLRGGVHVSHIDGPLPADTAGRVYPYALLWPGAGTPVEDDDVTGRVYQAAQTSTLTVTVASGDRAWTMQAARHVRHALTGALDGRVQPDRLQQRFAQIMRDPAERPARYYIPLTWTITDHA